MQGMQSQRWLDLEEHFGASLQKSNPTFRRESKRYINLFIVVSLSLFEHLMFLLLYSNNRFNYNQITEMQATVHRCTATVDFMEDRLIPYPPTINDEALFEHAKRVGEALLGKPNVKLSPLIMAAEDFSFYTQTMAASFFVIGISNETLIKSVIETHSPYFVIDEDVLPIGAAFHAAVAMAYFDSQLPSQHEYH